MCGICGFVGETEERQSALWNMMESIRHRGPDGEGTYHHPPASLGFRRLAIVDLDHGNQPMHTANQRFSVVFNGEIYNDPELRKTLEKRGHRYRTQCDTEILLHAYEEYGEEMLPKLRGMFAFAIWDQEQQELFAARDFFGIKPFYYTLIRGTLVFASEIKSLLTYPDCPRILNEEAFEQYLSFQYSPLAETFFKGIYKLMPGEKLRFRNGQLQLEHWGRPSLEPDETQTLAQSVSKLESVLRDSIRVHHRSDVEIGALLSSGVDSSYLATQLRGEKTFTVGFFDEDSFYNESRYAQALSLTLHKTHYQRTISAETYFNAVPEVQYFMDEPLADPAAVALYLVDQLAAEQVKVVFSGEGADELFAGYNIYREPQDVRPMKRLPLPLRRLLGSVAQRIPFYFKGRNFLIRGSQELSERYLGGASIFTYSERCRLLKNPKAAPPQTLTENCWRRNQGLDEAAQMQALDQEFWLSGDILLKGDKMSMAHSLEARVPYLDQEVYRVARTLPYSSRICKKSTKHAFRKVAEHVLPRQTASKKKLGFPVPIRVWLREECYVAPIRELFSGTVAAQFFHTEELIKLLHDHLHGKRDNSRKIWTIYCFLLWHRTFFEQQQVKKATSSVTVSLCSPLHSKR